MKYYLIIGAIIAFIIVVIWAGFFFRNLKIKKIGKDGEKKVASVLKKYSGIRSYKVINDLYLPLYDKTTQIDHVLIGFFGILVIETKNYSGEIYGDPKKKNWLHVMGKSQKKYEFYNPLMQNQGHIDCIRHQLAEEKLYNINIESLVVFPSKKVQLYVPKKLPIVNLKGLKKYIRQPRFEKDNNYDVELLYNMLLKHQVTDKKLISEHNKNVKSIAKNS